MGPPCDPIHGWAITEYQGVKILHCGWGKQVTWQFIHGCNETSEIPCPEFPGGCPGFPESFEIANKRWTSFFGGSGPNPNTGPFNNDCYHNNGWMRDRCSGWNCHSFMNRSIREFHVNGIAQSPVATVMV